MIIKLSLLAFVLTMLSACGEQEHPQAISVVAESRQCPALPQLPKDLAQPPRKVRFFPTTS